MTNPMTEEQVRRIAREEIQNAFRNAARQSRGLRVLVNPPRVEVERPIGETADMPWTDPLARR